MSWPRVLPVGESALSVELGDAIDPRLNARVRALDDEILRHAWPGLIETIPTYRSLMVLFDPLESSPKDVGSHLLEMASRVTVVPRREAPLKEVPTVYDGEDLDAIASQTGLTRSEVIRLHSSSEVMVYMLGFSPGFAYMGLLPEALNVPRRSTPRTRVPAGAVAMAGRQTSVYPSPNPSGWHLIGRSSLRLFDPRSDPPTFFLPGDRVRFVPTEHVPDRQDGTFESVAEPPRGEPAFEVLKRRAPQTTVQDLGRVGYQRYGVPVAGAADAPALRAANLLVANPLDAAGLECTIAGPIVLRFLRPIVFAITGADLGPVLVSKEGQQRRVPGWCSIRAQTGEILRFTERRRGARAYIAVAGGIDVPVVLGSRSTYMAAGLGGFRGRALEPGDVVHVLPPRGPIREGRLWPEEQVPRHSGDVTVRILWGPQEDYFTEKARETLVTESYEISVASDRWGCRLDGPRLEHGKANEIVSDGMMWGCVQVPPSGQPIVMLPDRATAGGYPKIATVVGADLPNLGQLMPGDRIRFRAVDLEESLEAVRRARAVEGRIARDFG